MLASVQPIGMALFMATPMVAWMRIRGHGWRHGFEMAVAMLVPWAVIVSLVAIGASTALPWLAQADGPAMYLGMLGKTRCAGGRRGKECAAKRSSDWRRGA